MAGGISGAAGGAASGAAAGSMLGPIGAIGGALIGAAGSFFSGKSAQDAAEKNYKHRYQWQVQDMKKAGINPMLAFSQGAPNVPQAQVPDYGDAVVKGASAGSQIQSARAMLQAQKDNLEADTQLKGTQSAANIANARKTVVDTGIIEPQLGYSSVNAERGMEKLEMEVQLLGKQAEKLDLDIKEVTPQQLAFDKEMRPLLLKGQQIMNEAGRLGLSEKQAESIFYDKMGGASPTARLILEAIKALK